MRSHDKGKGKERDHHCVCAGSEVGGIADINCPPRHGEARVINAFVI